VTRILVVDEDSVERNALVELLRSSGHEVTGSAALAEVFPALSGGEFDLVILDPNAGGGGDFEVLRQVRNSAPRAAVLAVARDGNVEEAVAAMRLGAFNYLNRPCDPNQIHEEVKRALESTLRSASGDATAAVTAVEDACAYGIVGASAAVRELLDLIEKVAETDSTVLITGETGTGKELVGRAVHKASTRRNRAFCALNSAAFPETLLESELFGHRRGAFTGAAMNKKGLFEHADRGTVFLDEVAEMPLSMQAKLLRFLQTGEIRPVGAEITRYVDVRLVAATNKELEREVEVGRFREDLYYRLAVIPIHVLPLRERREDIPLLVNHFLRRFSERLGKQVVEVEPAAMELMKIHTWPGNVRELENTIERGVALSRGTKIRLEDLPRRLQQSSLTASVSTAIPSLQDVERRHILQTLERVNWNRKKAAEILQISTTTLWRRLKEFEISEQSEVIGDHMRNDSPGA